MMIRILFAAAAWAVLPLQAAHGQTAEPFAQPTLRAEVTVASDLVRIGDVVENAGASATAAIFRAPDPGTTGTLPVPALLTALRAQNILGVETRGLREVRVTRSGRTLPASDLEAAVAQVLAQRMGVSDPAALALTFDREVQPAQLDLAYAAGPTPIAVRIDARGRFDVTFEITGDGSVTPIRLRFSGSAVETVDAVVLLRTIERGEALKPSDVLAERRPRAEAGGESISRDRAIGMLAKRQMRAGAVLRGADLAKPDLVQREQSVTLIYEAAGIYLTGHGKALESGADGDVVTVMNLSSKRTVTGSVSGRGQVTVATVAPRPARSELGAGDPAPRASRLSAADPAASVALAAAILPIQRQAE